MLRPHPSRLSAPVIRLLLALLAALSTLVLMALGLLQALELYSFNLRCQWRPARSPGEEVFLLVVDEGSVLGLDFGLFPWPRKVWAQLQSEFIDPLGPRCIAYDILFDQPDSLRGQPMKDSDDLLGEAIAKSGNVFLTATMLEPSLEPVSASKSKDYDPGWHPPSPSFVRRFAFDKEKVAPGRYYHGTSLIRPLPEFERNAKGVGYTNTPPDPDGTTRRFPLVMEYAGEYYAALPLLVICDYLNVDLKQVWVKPGQGILLPRPGGNSIRIPIDERANLLLNYYGPTVNAFPSFTIKEFLQALTPQASKVRVRTPPWWIKGRILIIGSIASSTHDLRPVAVSDLYPQVGNIATAIANVLNRDFLYPTSWRVNIALLVLVALSVAGVAQYSQRFFHPLILRLPLGLIGLAAQLVLQLIPTAALAAGYGWISYYALARYGWVIPMFYGLFCLALSYVMLTVYNFMTEERSKRWYHQTWGRYMSPEMIQKLQESPEHLNLGGEQREITLLFSDICGFTSMSERLTPQQVVEQLNEYFEAMVEIVHEEHGMLDKFIGDAMMVHFGSPHRAPDDALRAVRTGLRMQEKLKELSARWKEQGRAEWRIRIGINTGLVVVGNIGSTRRQEYTAIGDTVNTAQRLEANCPIGKVLISRATYEQVKDWVEVEPLDPIQVKGKAKPIEVFLVLGLKG